MTNNSARTLWRLQRTSAHVLVLFVFVHLGLMIYAVQNGLTASEILNRTQGHIGWFLFYLGFVVLTSVHAPIGIRNILREQVRLNAKLIDAVTWVYAGLIVVLGTRACWAVFSGGAI